MPEILHNRLKGLMNEARDLLLPASMPPVNNDSNSSGILLFFCRFMILNPDQWGCIGARSKIWAITIGMCHLDSRGIIHWDFTPGDDFTVLAQMKQFEMTILRQGDRDSYQLIEIES